MTSETRSQAQRSRDDFDVYMENCRSRKLLELIGGKWYVMVICAIGEAGADGARTSELRRKVSGVSQKVLTQTLRSMERDGLVTRTVEPVVPPKVTYTLTSSGASLMEILVQVKNWAEANMGPILEYRASQSA